MADLNIRVSDKGGAHLTDKDPERQYIGLNGAWFELDLTAEEAEEMEAALADWLDIAKRATNPPATRRAAARPSTASGTSATAGWTKEQVEELRVWARANGHQVGEKGKVAAAVVEAYEGRNARPAPAKAPAKKAAPKAAPAAPAPE